MRLVSNLFRKKAKKKVIPSALRKEIAKEFDAEFYLKQNEDVAASRVDPLGHYIRHGMMEDRQPRGDFHPGYYRRKYSAELFGRHPFIHWILEGKAKGYLGHPWQSNSKIDEIALMKAEFDQEFYARVNPDVVKAGVDLFGHFLEYGWIERRDPSASFSIENYLKWYPELRATGLNPFAHYVTVAKSSGKEIAGTQSPSIALLGAESRLARGGQPTSSIFADHLRFASKGPQWEARDPTITEGQVLKAKIMAYYLPQFHPIPENDVNWGVGFTEWRNVIRGVPRFHDHYQPRVPEELGFYDLRDPDVLRRQAKMAKEAGIHAFCFYYYSFNGKRVLEKPINNFLAARDIDLQFAILWANENWTRTWDGLDASVLLKQDYREEDEPTLIADVARHFSDPRYIRIDGRPIFFIYRPAQIPDAKLAIERWRDMFRTRHNEIPLMFMCQAMDDNDPREYGLDGAIEFPPHKVCSGLPPLNHYLEAFDPEFKGHVVSYNETIERSVSEPPPPFPLIKGATPFWDNEARRPGRGMVLHGSTPVTYEAWLRQLVAFAHRNPVFGESFVAINAWNEWAEGAYLEPDVYNGSAYLNATARAVTDAPKGRNDKTAGKNRQSHGRGRTAVVTHAFYPEMLTELIPLFEKYENTAIFFTTVPEKLLKLQEMLKGVSFEYEIIVNENRGRDVSHFLVALKRLVSDQFEFVLKLHTKKSTQLSNGDLWRQEMYDLLAEPEQFERIISAINCREDVGMVGPEGHIVPLRLYWGSNEARVCELLLEMGIDKLYIDSMRFVAGTMFVARVKTLEPVLELGLSFEDFEPEEGQIDGTLAHALERIFSICASLDGMSICSASADTDNALTNVVEHEYAFV